ncbi:hypothetical protein [Acetobacter sp. DsW_063]|uniref:hypothetical protein n=1 Tax=Acetobacter sp. DsW_063 TaxID=1514894 RepID=UPI0011784FAB|nr:hypothetical protein [Acetobacter sp. DsW_063]
MKNIFLVAAIISLPACTERSAVNEHNKAYAECDRIQKNIPENYYSHARCLNNADNIMAKKTGYDQFVIMSINSSRNVIAKKLDSGTIGKEQAQAEFQKSVSEAKAHAASGDTEQGEQSAEVKIGVSSNLSGRHNMAGDAGKVAATPGGGVAGEADQNGGN